MKRISSFLLVLAMSLSVMSLPACACETSRDGMKTEVIHLQADTDVLSQTENTLGLRKMAAAEMASKYPKAQPKAGKTEKGTYVYEYEINGHGITVTRCSGDLSDGLELVIPSEIGGKRVTEIGSGAFLDCHYLKKITIPDAVTKIGDMAFAFCYSLEEVNFPRNLEIIGELAFAECGLKQLSLPSGLKSIEGYAFERCYDLKTVVIPESVTSLGDGAFWECKKLDWASIPWKCKVGEDAFPEDCIVRQSNPPHFRNDIETVSIGAVYGKWEDTEINGQKCGMLHLNSPINGMAMMTVDLEIEMKKNAKCENWDLYYWNGNNWENIGEFYLPEGTGSVSATVYGDGEMYVEWLAVVPMQKGEYSWTQRMSISEAWKKA